MKKVILYLSILLIISLLVSFTGCGSAEGAEPIAPQQRLRVATTTSLYDTGLWGYLEPMFEKQHGIELDVMYAGTGKALEYGMRGDVDVITVHSKNREEKFVAEGYGVERIPFAFNYFLIVGPPDDPASIKDMTPASAFRSLFETGSESYISRGDESGTHGKEMAIWKAAGYDYEAVRKAGEWYIEAGRGMGPTLLMASEKQGYTLTDMGTFLSFKGKLELMPVVDKGGILLNVYSVIAGNPEKNNKINYQMANNMVAFLTAHDIQELIQNYGTNKYGMSLFNACAGAEPKQ